MRFFAKIFVYLCSSLGARKRSFSRWCEYVKWMINEFISMNHRRQVNEWVIGRWSRKSRNFLFSFKLVESVKYLKRVNEWFWKVKKEMRTKEIRVINRFLVHLWNQHSETSSLYSSFFKTHHRSFSLSLARSHNIKFLCVWNWVFPLRAKEEITWNKEIFDGTLTVRFPFYHRVYTFFLPLIKITFSFWVMFWWRIIITLQHMCIHIMMSNCYFRVIMILKFF